MRHYVKSYAVITLGSILYALAYNIFYAPNLVAMGGLTDGVNTRDMAAAFAVFPNMGTYKEPRTYTKVLDQDGKLDYSVLKPVLFEMPTYSYLRTGEMIDKCIRPGKEYREMITSYGKRICGRK